MVRMTRQGRTTAIGIVGMFLIGMPLALAKSQSQLSVEEAHLTFAPDVPPPITRRRSAIVRVHLDSGMSVMEISAGVKYHFWTFNGRVPGPFIRARVGDTLEVHVTNSDDSGMPHNVDLHAVTGPGGGATVVEFGVEVPGTYTLVDHAIFRVEQGAVGFLQVEGEPRHDLYISQDDAATCKGCLVHP